MRGSASVSFDGNSIEVGASPSSAPSAGSGAPSPRERGEGILILGAGIVGVCAAANLAEAGIPVTIIDRSGVCEETSSGNAAAFAFSDVLPLAQKGALAQVPKWLLDPLGPLAIPPAYLPRLLPWLIRFWRAGRLDRYDAAVAAQGSMMKLAESEWMGLLDRAGARDMLREDGSLELYESEDEFQASLSGWRIREKLGIAFEHVGRDGLAAYQPGLSPRLVKGTFVPGWKTVADPKLLGKAIWAHAEARGARFVRGEAVAAGSGADGAGLTLADGTELRAGKLVIAAGSWSRLFARHFGDNIPLETERGYNTTLPSDAFDLRRMLIFGGHGFVVTPLSTGIRVGGAVELAGLKRPPNYARAQAMLDKAKRFLPGLKTEGGRQWMGYRPSLPDSLPAIGRARGAPNVVYAFGHGHLGLTQAAATGRLVRDLVTGATTPIDLSPFSPQRF